MSTNRSSFRLPLIRESSNGPALVTSATYCVPMIRNSAVAGVGSALLTVRRSVWSTSRTVMQSYTPHGTSNSAVPRTSSALGPGSTTSVLKVTGTSTGGPTATPPLKNSKRMQRVKPVVSMSFSSTVADTVFSGLTVTFCTHVLTLPQSSTAVHTTGVVPDGNTLPDGTRNTVGVPVQLSFAAAVPGFTIVGGHVPAGALIVMFDGQVITGA